MGYRPPAFVLPPDSAAQRWCDVLEIEGREKGSQRVNSREKR